MKILLFVVFLGSQFLATQSFAASVNWEAFRSEMAEITAFASREGEIFSTYPVWMQSIYTDLFDWEPRVKEGPVSSECRPSFSSSELKNRIEQLQNLISSKPECVYRTDGGEKPSFKKLMQALSVHFDISDKEHFRKVYFYIPGRDGKKIRVRGLLGLHDDLKKRPMVVLRMGVHGNIDEFLAERFIVKLAYEDFDFNFLALENLTSHGYLATENPITFGGVDEALQTYYILNELNKNAGFKKIISDLHLVGISLGGHGTFLAQTLDERQNRFLKTATLLCPVVNLDETLRFHSGKSLNSAIIDLWNHRRLKAVPERLTNVDDGWWKTFFDLTPRFTPMLLDKLETQNVTPAEKIPDDLKDDELKKHFTSSKSFSQLNNFWPYYQDKMTPVLIMTTEDDLLVSREINTERIQAGKQPGDFTKTVILPLKRGTHCALASDFQWSFVKEIFATQWN